MNKPVSASDLVTPKVTTGPLIGSRKTHVTPERAPDLKVPLREIMLTKESGEAPLPVYDTSGPYTDNDVAIDLEKGLKRTRIEWVKERGGVEELGNAQVFSATAGKYVPVSQFVERVDEPRAGPAGVDGGEEVHRRGDRTGDPHPTARRRPGQLADRGEGVGPRRRRPHHGAGPAGGAGGRQGDGHTDPVGLDEGGHGVRRRQHVDLRRGHPRGPPVARG